MPLERYTTFKIGGPAEYFIEPEDTGDLKAALTLAGLNNLAVSIIGSGSNLLVSDKGIDGVVIKLSSAYFKKISFSDTHIIAGAGCSLARVIADSQKRSLSSLEFLAGIPGTVGGSLAGNAGSAGKNIGDFVEDITVMDYNGVIRKFKKDDLEFGYRYSSVIDYIVLEARFRCVRKESEKIRQDLKRYLDARKKNQDLSFPSAGCVFKNPASNNPAGRLIDLCGLKGQRIGDACVSGKHANFIVNMGRAKSEDVTALMGLIRQKVEDKFNVSLEPEIKLWK